MNKIVFINPLADFCSSPVAGGSWNSFVAPRVLCDFFESKGIPSDFVNLNDLFIRKFFSEQFIGEFFELSKKHLSSLEKKESLENYELTEYLSSKFMIENILKDKNDGSENEIRGRQMPKQKYAADLSPLANLLMRDVDILQPGDIKADRNDADFNRRAADFDRVMGAVLDEFDFDGKLLVFSVPSKAHMSSMIQTSKLIKKMFPRCKILIGGSYIKFTYSKILDDLAAAGIIDFYIKDADESKLLCLAREFLDGSLGDFRGSYAKSAEPVSINELVRRTVDVGRRQILLLSSGCYWGRCRYCEYAVVRKNFAIKKTNVIADEIEYFYKKGVKDFRLLTDCLIPAAGVNIAKELIRRNIKITWDCLFIRIDLGFTKEAILLLKESGFQFDRVNVGMESCVDAALKNVDKGYDRKTIEDFFHNFRELGIKFSQINVIFDIPGTTAEDVQDMKKFILELYDVCRGFLGLELYVSDKIELGMHPEKYNIQLLGVDERNKFGDTLLFRLENGLPEEDKNSMKKFCRLLSLLSSANQIYPSLDTAKLARTKIYTEKDFRLLVKMDGGLISFSSAFDENGKRGMTKFTAPAKLKEFACEGLFLFRHFEELEKGRWYSAGDIAEVIGYSSEIEKMKLMQIIFHSVIAILSGRGFADAKIENVKKTEITAGISAERKQNE